MAGASPPRIHGQCAVTAGLIGYEFLKDVLGTSAFPMDRPAQISSVTKVTPMQDALAVPATVAPVARIRRWVKLLQERGHDVSTA